MSLFAGILLLVAALALIVLGAVVLLSGITSAASRFSIPAFSLTVLLSGLELENIAAGVAANVAGFPGAAIGTSLGGVVFLSLAVTGFGALLAPFQYEMPPRVTLWVAASSLPLGALAFDGALTRWDGFFLVLAFVVFISGLARAGIALDDDDDDDQGGSLLRLGHPLARIALGLGLFAVGGSLLSDGLRNSVGRLPGGATLLGNTAIAAAVEAEEIARVAVPARRGRADVSVGNLAGTIVHFLTLNVGIIALVRPLPVDELTRRFYLPAAVVAPALCFILLSLRHGADRKLSGLLLGAYLLYLVLSLLLFGGS